MSVQEPPLHRRLVAEASYVERLIAERRRLGLDRRDEVWNEEYQMSPAPSSEHDRIEHELDFFVTGLVRAHGLGRVGQLNVREPGTRDQNFRVPDRVFVASGRASIVSDWGCEGGPDIVFEVRSPGDDTYEKLPFYGEVGVTEAVVIDRDTKRVEVFRNAGGKMLPVSPATDGWLVVEPLGLALRRLERRDGSGALEVRDTRDPARGAEI